MISGSCVPPCTIRTPGTRGPGLCTTCVGCKGQTFNCSWGFIAQHLPTAVGSTVWVKLCSCRDAAVTVSDGLFMPACAAVMPHGWCTPQEFSFLNVPISTEDVGIHPVCSFGSAQPGLFFLFFIFFSFIHSVMNMLINWCFYSRK